jgi:hypothetical protein
MMLVEPHSAGIRNLENVRIHAKIPFIERIETAFKIKDITPFSLFIRTNMAINDV